MSVEAVGWAFRQRLPPLPKIVLLALADQADERTGHVCYGRTDMAHLAEKTAIGARSIYRYISALIRNGYVIRESGRQHGRESSYWLCLNRRRSLSVADWKWFDILQRTRNKEENESTQDVVGPHETADAAADLSRHRSNAAGGRGGLPPTVTQRVYRKHQDILSSESVSETSSFDPRAQALEVESMAIAKVASKAGANVFVIRNSRAWNAWIEYRRDVLNIRPGGSMPVTERTDERGRKLYGWWCPSLFPPRAPAPQPEPLAISQQDLDDFTST
jgi:hypothetical protein